MANPLIKFEGIDPDDFDNVHDYIEAVDNQEYCDDWDESYNIISALVNGGLTAYGLPLELGDEIIAKLIKNYYRFRFSRIGCSSFVYVDNPFMIFEPIGYPYKRKHILCEFSVYDNSGSCYLIRGVEYEVNPRFSLSVKQEKYIPSYTVLLMHRL